MLKQIRSKFDHISTYTECRSSSSIASRLEYQPVTIWTLSNQETNQSAMSQEKIASLLFREIANQAISNGKDAVLNITAVESTIGTSRRKSSVAMIIQNMQGLFEEDQQDRYNWQRKAQ
ncbi:hypothetical protein RMATCC62417_18452 [Rhizopus microsporus]|nr:hypothetical protein RMATCC62417_18452 [Rhizopus microsporus]